MPFGPRASGAGVMDAEGTTPVRPDDFWGEKSASIHDVMQPPDTGAAAAIIAPTGEHGKAAPIIARAEGVGKVGPIIARAVGLGNVAPIIARAVGLGRSSRSSPARRRAISLMVVGVVALACSAIALTRLGSQGGRQIRHTSLLTDREPRPPLASGLAGDPVIRPSTSVRRAPAKGGAVVVNHRVHVVGSSPSPSPSPSPSSESNSTSAGTPSQPHASSSLRSTGASSTAAAPASGASNSEPSSASVTSASASGAPQGSAASRGSGSNAPAGPDGPGAPFGPGHLG